MSFLIFIGGLIVGILVRDIKTEVLKSVKEIKQDQEFAQGTQFFEGESVDEKFKNAKNIGDFVK